MRVVRVDHQCGRTKSVALSLVMTLLVVLAGVAAPADADAGRAVDTVAHGVRLSLSVLQSDYPENALVRVTLRVENVGSRRVNVGRGSADDCDSYSPHALVETEAGTVLYPPAISPGSLHSCPSAGGYAPLPPGKTVTTQEYVILRADLLRAQLIIPVRGGTQWLATPPLTLNLYPVRPPAVRLRIRRLPSATVVRPPGARGPLYVVSNWYCTWPNPFYGYSASLASSQVWVEQNSTRLTAGGGQCRRVLWWRAVAGWLDEPVATVRYGRQPGSP